MGFVSWNRGFWLRVGTKQLPSVKQTPKLDSLLLPGQFCPFLQRWAWGRSLWILVLGCTKGVGETEPGRCSNYKHPVQRCASQPHAGLPPTGHSIQSPLPAGDPRAPPSCSPHVCPGLRQPLPSISSHQAFISSQATRNVKFPFCAGASAILSVAGLCICYSFTITLMGFLEEEEINKTVQSTATPSSPENWAVTKCEAASLWLIGKRFFNTEFAKEMRQQSILNYKWKHLHILLRIKDCRVLSLGDF